MKFVVSGLTVAFCFWMWMRFQDSDEYRWLIIGGVALIIGISVSNRVGDLPAYASYAEDETCYRFRGNECF